MTWTVMLLSYTFLRTLKVYYVCLTVAFTLLPLCTISEWWTSCPRREQEAAPASTLIKKWPGLQRWLILLHQALGRMTVTSKSKLAEDLTYLYFANNVAVWWTCFFSLQYMHSIKSLVLFTTVPYFPPERVQMALWCTGCIMSTDIITVK